MEFGWDPALDKLRREAEEVALRAAADLPVKEDSWINGYDRDFSRELGERARPAPARSRGRSR